MFGIHEAREEEAKQLARLKSAMIKSVVHDSFGTVTITTEEGHELVVSAEGRGEQYIEVKRGGQHEQART